MAINQEQICQMMREELQRHYGYLRSSEWEVTAGTPFPDMDRSIRIPITVVIPIPNSISSLKIVLNVPEDEEHLKKPCPGLIERFRQVLRGALKDLGIFALQHFFP